MSRLYVTLFLGVCVTLLGFGGAIALMLRTAP